MTHAGKKITAKKMAPPLDKIEAILQTGLSHAPAKKSKPYKTTLKPRLPPGVSKNLMLANQVNLASIAGSVLRASSGSERRTLLVTSANAGEGKTTIATNIAFSLAQQANVRTVIVDANLHNPRLHQLFEVDQDPGVETLLFDELEPESTLHATDQNNLYMMSLGQTEHGFLSLFNPGRVRFVLEKLTRLFHVVIFDGPPVFGSSDPAIITSCFNHVLLVVECEKTRWEVAITAKERLQSGGGSVTGVILNRRQHYIPQRIYAQMK
jgi:protein-tyrosine kinase